MIQTTARWTTYRVPDRVPDDTEERIVGTEWHQEAIGDLAARIRESARRAGTSWGITEQVALAGLRHEDGRPYDPRPDVMVLPYPLPSGRLSTISLEDAGIPLFIAEIVSRSTKGEDLGDKRSAYQAIGVAEYVVFDADGTLLSQPLIAWRFDGASGSYLPWTADSDGWWRSASLGIALYPTQPLLDVRDRRGELIPSIVAAHTLLDEERRQRSALEEELRRLRGRDEISPCSDQPGSIARPDIT